MEKENSEPLLQINTTAGGIVTQILYKDSARATLTTAVLTNEAPVFGLYAYPNPSGTVQSIIYSLKEPAEVNLEVFDLAGNKIITLANEHQASDKHIYTLNLRDEKFSSSIYMRRLSVNGKSYFQKLLVTK